LLDAGVILAGESELLFPRHFVKGKKGADRGMGLGLESYITSIYPQKNKRKAKCPTQHSSSSLSLSLFSK
jgi:hypothetical protein